VQLAEAGLFVRALLPERHFDCGARPQPRILDITPHDRLALVARLRHYIARLDAGACRLSDEAAAQAVAGEPIRIQPGSRSGRLHYQGDRPIGEPARADVTLLIDRPEKRTHFYLTRAEPGLYVNKISSLVTTGNPSSGICTNSVSSAKSDEVHCALSDTSAAGLAILTVCEFAPFMTLRNEIMY
jgi:hypothetical protein